MVKFSGSWIRGGNFTMSNVLIGIIGVILFIGLALAGALFLGPRFQESTNNSKASAVVQVVSQIANAANMYRVQEGTPVFSGGDLNNLVITKYLKSLPSNPLNSTDSLYAPMALRAEGQPVSSSAAEYVLIRVPDSNLSVCEAIAKQIGQDPVLITTAGFIPLRPTGCFKSNGSGNLTSNWLYAFAAI